MKDTEKLSGTCAGSFLHPDKLSQCQIVLCRLLGSKGINGLTSFVNDKKFQENCPLVQQWHDYDGGNQLHPDWI